MRKVVDLLNTNSYEFQNAQLFEVIDRSPTALKKTEISYEYGQLYSPENSWKVEVQQNFGNITEILRSSEKNEVEKKLMMSDYLFKKKKKEVEIKSLILELIYLYGVLENHKLLNEYSDMRLHVSRIKAELGETEPLDELKLATKVSNIEYQLIFDQIQIEKIQNKLKALLNIDKILIPKNRKMELYMIDKLDDTVKYAGAYLSDIYLNRYNLSLSDIRLKKAAFSPEIKFGFFYQEIGSNPNMTGVRMSVCLPLWYKQYTYKVKESRLLSQIEYNNYLQVENNIKAKIENLLLELEESFLRIRQAKMYSLPESNLQLTTVEAKYKHEEMDYEEYIDKISEALSIKRNYLDLINHYNQTAVKLELYLK